LKAELAWLVDP